MDGAQRETERRRKVVRSFEGSRLEAQLTTTAYEWVMPWIRCGEGAGHSHPAPGEMGVAVPRRARGA